MFRINYAPPSKVNLEGAVDQFTCQTTFTYLDWRILDKVYQEDEIAFDSIDNAQVMEICHCLFPRFRTALHVLLDKEGLLESLLQATKQTFTYHESEISGYDIPFFKDFSGATPIH